MSEIIAGVLSLIGIFVTGFTTHFFTKKKTTADIKSQNAETEKTEAVAKQSELDNVEKAVAIWRKLAEDIAATSRAQTEALNKQVDELLKQRIDLKTQLDQMSQKLEESSSQNKKILDKMTQLEKDYKKLQANYVELKKSLP